MWQYNHANELYHHGVKGMKWGRGKSNFNSGQSSERAKKLADGKLDAQVKLDKLYDEYDKKMKDINKQYRPKDNEWLKDQNDYKSGYSNKALDYIKKTDAAYEQLSKMKRKLQNEKTKEEHDIRKSTFFFSEIKKDVYSARDVKNQLEKVRDETIGESSKNAQEAYQKYLKNHKDDGDSEYGFYHYTWREGNPDYDKANKEYRTKSEELSKDYDKKITEIGKKAFGQYASEKTSNPYFKTYADFGKSEIDNIIYFRNELFNT